MKNKTKNEIEQYVHKYCWENLSGNQTWSNTYYDLVMVGYDFAEKGIKDKLNHYKSRLKELKTEKLSKRIDEEKIKELEIRIDTLNQLIKQ